jgi:DNA invertase Pin-like site-specific DNA recombinase
MKAAIYARVSTFDQEPENQLQELRRYVSARSWSAVEYVDRGVSGTKDRRPALDEMLTDARRRKFDVVICWRLDRLGRNLRHLITLLDDLQAVGIGFVTLGRASTLRHRPDGSSSMSFRPSVSLKGTASRNVSRRGYSGPGRKGASLGDPGVPSPLTASLRWHLYR